MSGPGGPEVRDLVDADLPVVRRIMAGAFAGEPIARGMFGDSILDQLVGMAGDYATWPWAEGLTTLVVEDRGMVLGAAAASPPGSCKLCDRFHHELRDGATVAERIEHEFQLACQIAHVGADLPPHAHITSVAIDPLAHGAGLGQVLVAGLLEQIWADDTDTAVLECLTTRESFYARFGFRTVASFPDPAGPDLTCVLMRLDRAG
jgi:ribosomal protein S18 acetylase RimI-like enzyme